MGLVDSAFQHLNNQSLGNETVWSQVSLDWILSPQEVVQNQIRLKLYNLLQQQNSVVETKIFMTIPHNTQSDFLLQCVTQFVA